MLRPWRLTRTPQARAVYEFLTEHGLTATWMTEYRRPLGEPPEAPDPGMAVGVREPAAVEALAAPVEQLVDGERVVAAVEDGVPRGYLFLSVDATHRIHPLERELRFEEAYVRRVFVDPDHRQRGVASALLAVACREARAMGATEATALVALDNGPSRALFRRCGFTAARERRYARAGPLSWRSVRAPG